MACNHNVFCIHLWFENKFVLGASLGDPVRQVRVKAELLVAIHSRRNLFAILERGVGPLVGIHLRPRVHLQKLIFGGELLIGIHSPGRLVGLIVITLWRHFGDQNLRRIVVLRQRLVLHEGVARLILSPVPC